MEIVAEYSHAGGREFIYEKHADLLDEMRDAVATLDKAYYKSIELKEIQKPLGGDPLAPASALMRDVKGSLEGKGWARCWYEGYVSRASDIISDCYFPKYKRPIVDDQRDLGLSKNRLGMNFEAAQFEDVMFNVAQMFTVFKNLGLIDAGLLVVPTRSLFEELDLYGSYFDLFVADLVARGAANIDIPMLVWGFE